MMFKVYRNGNLIEMREFKTFQRSDKGIVVDLGEVDAALTVGYVTNVYTRSILFELGHVVLRHDSQNPMDAMWDAVKYMFRGEKFDPNYVYDRVEIVSGDKVEFEYHVPPENLAAFLAQKQQALAQARVEDAKHCKNCIICIVVMTVIGVIFGAILMSMGISPPNP